MIVEAGHYALVLAFALSLFQASVPLIGVRIGGCEADAQRALCCARAVRFRCDRLCGADLCACHVRLLARQCRMRIRTPRSRSSTRSAAFGGTTKARCYLWVLVLSICGASVALFSRIMPEPLRAGALGVQGWIGAAFLLFVLATSNPFARFAEAPLEGQDLNPILQDPGLAIHPPLLYLGYVGFSVTFSFAAAALISGRVDAGWARIVRPWVLAAWTFLTLGIAMGSYWAYYTLGWGGFWFWDPVENASLYAMACRDGAFALHERHAEARCA